jgi:hypothetical protein
MSNSVTGGAVEKRTMDYFDRLPRSVRAAVANARFDWALMTWLRPFEVGRIARRIYLHASNTSTARPQRKSGFASGAPTTRFCAANCRPSIRARRRRGRTAVNAVDQQLRRAASQEARAHRVEMYADWIAHDADGLAFAIAHPGNLPFPHSTAILAEARALVALTLSRLDRAIEADRAAHAQQDQEQA